MAYHKADQFDFAMDAFNLTGETTTDGAAEQARLDAERELIEAAARAQELFSLDEFEQHAARMNQ
jgi:hypothetical protein